MENKKRILSQAEIKELSKDPKVKKAVAEIRATTEWKSFVQRLKKRGK